MAKPICFSYKEFTDLREAYRQLLEDNAKLVSDNRKLRTENTNLKIRLRIEETDKEELRRAGCLGCDYFSREFENNNIWCDCRSSEFYNDIPPGDPCEHWKAKE